MIDSIKKEKKIGKGIIRKFSKYMLELIKKNGVKKTSLGLYYILFHNLIIFLFGFNLAFNVNVNHLIVLLIIISLDAFSIVVLHGCPLTSLEQKYLGTNGCDERTNQFKELGIFYKCEHEYEKQLELLTNVWSLIAVKILILIMLRIFNFKLKNYNNIYE